MRPSNDFQMELKKHELRFNCGGGAGRPGPVRAERAAAQFDEVALFQRVLEVRASIPGRMRLFVPSLAGGMEQALQVREQLLGTGVVHRVELEPLTGSMLVCYDERKG